MDLKTLEAGETVFIRKSGIDFKVVKKNDRIVKISSECILLKLDLETRSCILEDFAMLIADKHDCPEYGPHFVDRMFQIIHSINREFGMIACTLSDLSFFRESRVKERSMTRVLDLLRGYSMYDKQGFMRVDNASWKTDPVQCVEVANEFLSRLNRRACSYDFWHLLELYSFPETKNVYFSETLQLSNNETIRLQHLVQELFENRVDTIPKLMPMTWKLEFIIRDCEAIRKTNLVFGAELFEQCKTLREALQYTYELQDSELFDQLGKFVTRSESSHCITFYQDTTGSVTTKFHAVECGPYFSIRND